MLTFRSVGAMLSGLTAHLSECSVTTLSKLEAARSWAYAERELSRIACKHDGLVCPMKLQHIGANTHLAVRYVVRGLPKHPKELLCCSTLLWHLQALAGLTGRPGQP